MDVCAGLKTHLKDLPRAVFQQIPMSIAIILGSLWAFAAHPLYTLSPRLFMSTIGLLYAYILVCPPLSLSSSTLTNHNPKYLGTINMSTDLSRVYQVDVCYSHPSWGPYRKLVPCEAARRFVRNTLYSVFPRVH